MAAAAVLKPIPPTSLPDATSSSSLSSFPVLPPLISRLPPALLASPSTPVPTPAPSVGYTESHLPAVDEASLALHHALHKFHVIDVEHYANAPYDQAFNWSELKLPEEVVREWYIVAFRSVRRKGADTGLLYQADRDAHEEAVTAGGLLLYWYGAPNEKGENLATCIWQSRQHALVANRNPKHAIAASLAQATYDTYKLERYVLSTSKGTQSVTVRPWTGGEVGY